MSKWMMQLIDAIDLSLESIRTGIIGQLSYCTFKFSYMIFQNIRVEEGV